MAITKVKGAVLEPLTVADVAVDSISASDGTQAATIADVTGVMTIGSSVLTSADINGGTVDNSVIGGATPAAITGTTITANTSLNIAGDGATVTGIKDEDDMSSNSATKLATQQSIKAYVDSQVSTVDTWSEVLANGATSGTTNPEIDAGQFLKTDTINETTVGSGVTVDSVLLKDDVVNATDVEVSSISANDGTEAATIADVTGVMTIGSSVLTSADINGGTIDGTTIGATTPAVGTFSQVNVNGNVVSDGADLDGAVTINESGADVDFRVESATNQHALFVQGSDGFVGVGESAPLANMHIKQGASGVPALGGGADALLIESNTPAGITIASPNTTANAICFADGDSSVAGILEYDHPTDLMRFYTNTVSRLELSATEAVFNEPGNDVDFRVESDTNTHALFVQGSDGRVGIGTSTPSGAVHIETGASNPLVATAADDLVIEGSLQTGITIASPETGGVGAIYFANENDDDQGSIRHFHGSGGGALLLGVSGLSYFHMFKTVTVINEAGEDHDFRVESDTNTHALFVQGSDGYVGINEASPAGVLHISNPSTPGSATGYPANGDELILEGANNVGMTILSGAGAGSRIYFGDSSDPDDGQILYNNATDTMEFWADTSTFFGAQIKLKQGVQVGAPTGGFKGTGTLNAVAVYDDDTLLTDFVLDQAVDGEIDFDFYDSLELGGKAAREWDARNLDIDHYEAQWRERKALPSFRSKAERFDDNGNEIRDSMGTLIQGLQQELETAMVHIAQLNARIKQLEEK